VTEEKQEVKIEEKVEPVQAPQRYEEFNILDMLRGGGLEELDPITRMLVTQDILDEWRERREERRAKKRESLTPEQLAQAISQSIAEALKPVVETLKPALETANKSKAESEAPEWAKNLMARIDALESRFKAEEEEKRLRKIIQEEVDSRIAPIAERVSRTESSALTKKELETLIDNIWKRYRESGEKSEKLGDIITDEITNLLKERVRQSLKESLTAEPIEVAPSEKITKKDIIGIIRQILRTVEKALPPQPAPPRVMPPAPEQPPQAETATTATPTIQQAEQSQPAPAPQPATSQSAGATGGSEGRPVEATAQPPTSEQQ
jgi:hypothetical protein